jgi:AcrR family transcriptional regulator
MDDGAVHVQQRTTRAVGRANMIAAARGLLAERGPEEITVREIADRSGHHHRFVQAWFGGKVGLFRAVFDQLAAEMAERAPNTLGAQGFAPDTRLAAHLMNWLVATDPASLAEERPTPVLDNIVQVYLALGLETELAWRMARRLMATAMGMILFGDALGVAEDDIAGFVELERELAVLLAEARSGVD